MRGQEYASHSVRRRRPGRRRLLCALALTLALLSGLSFSHPQLARAAGNGPIINWDSTMIFPGQNNGNPWGPPGEQATVHGQKFTTANQKLNLVLVAGDSDSTPTVCHNSLILVAQVTVSTTGTFDANFIWPTTVNQAGFTYSICALSTKGAVVSTQDGTGPFTVLTANPPMINVSANTVAAGNTVTVTGQNWVPPQSVEVDVTLNHGPGFITNATLNASNLNSGTFSTTLTIPANTTPGDYTVTAFTTQNNLLNVANTNGTIALAVTAPVVATPTPSVTVTPTPTATPTAVATPTASANLTPSITPTAIANSGGSNNNGNTPNNSAKSLVFILLIALSAIILAIGGLLLFMLAQRKRPVPPFGPNLSPRGAGGANPYVVSSNPGAQELFNGSPGGTGYNQPLFQQAQSSNTACVRCSRPLPPNSLICSACGLHNGLPFDPDGPTLAY
jgi:hypothetical protein